MVGTQIGTDSHVCLCSAISGSGTSVTYDSSGTFAFIKSKEPEFEVSFDSKIKNNAYHKQRQTPDVNYKQSFSVQDGILLSTDVNTITEWLIGAYIAKSKIYLLVDMPDATTGHTKKSFYNDSNTKVYYCKGFLNKLKIKMQQGKVWRANFGFVECW